MAAMSFVLCFSILCLLPNCMAYLIFEDTFSNVQSCEELCENTYPMHTYDKAMHLSYCLRGCRLYTIIDFVDEYDDQNMTRDSCIQACQEAYSEPDDSGACSVGCGGHQPAIERRQQLQQRLEFGDQGGFLFPFMYVHSLYSNMVDKLMDHATVSWSFYMQNNNGQMVVMRSGPHYESDFDEFPTRDGPDYKTSNYLETNLAEVDNSATPNLKSSQVHAMERGLDEAFDSVAAPQDGQPTDWLDCIAKKMRLPRLLLTMTLFVAVMIIIWLCVTTAFGTQEQKAPPLPQKLSIYGDLEYLREMNSKDLLAATHKPQEANHNAPPLPIKIKIQRI